jgi:hypothetical protein
VDAALYLDTDTLVLQDVRHLQAQVQAMRSQSAIVYASPDSDASEDLGASETCSASTGTFRSTARGIIFSAADHCALSYVKSQRVPFYGPRGLQVSVRSLGSLQAVDLIQEFEGLGAA